jgi:HlyD family secretion protein
MSTLQVFNDYVNNGFYARKKAMTANDLRSLKNTSQAIQNQKKLTQDDIKLAEETFNMNQKLFEEKVLAPDELRQQNSKYINKQLAIHQLDASISSNELQQREKEKELEQLEHDMRQQPEIFQQSLQSLKSQIEEWKKKYVLQSAINGRASYIIPIQENQFLQAGKTIGYIVPDNGRFYLTTYLPQGNFGKVDTGLAVQLRFDAYPYQENGAVTGTVSYISNIASDNGFLTTIRLDKGLVTNTNKSIPFKSGLTAQAMVITKNISLLNRLWYNVARTFSVNNKEK